MKVRVLSFLGFAVFLTFLISSYKEGPAYYGGYDCTGATGSRYGCSGGGCHGSTSSNNVVIELDSAGVAVHSYYPGVSYTVKISATNGTGQNLPYFGFQMAIVKLAGAGTSTPTQIGNWDSTSMPANVHYLQAGPFSCPTCSGWAMPIVEHSAAIQALGGSGGNGTTYGESITWTAPDSGSGTVLLYGALNAVNHDGSNTGDYSQPAIADTIAEAIPPHTNTGISELKGSISGLNVYPTLMNDNITVRFDQQEACIVSISMVSLDGRAVKSLMTGEQVGEGNFKRSFDVSGLASGVYLVKVQVGAAMGVSKVVKD